MKSFLLCLFFVQAIAVFAQSNENMPEDTTYLNQLLISANKYNFSKADSGLIISEKALEIARRFHFKKEEAEALHVLGESFQILGNFPQALKMQFEALQINREMNDKTSEEGNLSYIGYEYIQMGEYREALQYLMLAKKIIQQSPDFINNAFVQSNIGDAYDFLKMPDSALYYQRKAYENFSKLYRPHLRSFILLHIGNIYAELGKNDSALKFYHAGLLNCHLSNDKINMSSIQKQISEVYNSIHRDDSSLYYAHEAFLNAQNAIAKPQVLDAGNLLAAFYRKKGNYDSAFFYMDIISAIKDSLYGREKFRQLQVLMLNEQQRQQAIIQHQEQFRNMIKYISLLAVLGIFLLLAFILYRNNRHKQKANILLNDQKNKIENTLAELKSTQAQLIQSEKMASLGELTAGIAHEIQNPLNFVNNFSDVNKDLLGEMKDEIEKGNTEEAKAIANDILANEEKINHHGKRAGDIVKGMLQHSRSSTGVKEPTAINALADEYLRLSYQGLRAKDKTFNAELKTDFDSSIGKINIIPQDIGRVLLNLFNNAFYAVNEQKSKNLIWYEPAVSVTTKKSGKSVIITVSDNGIGIPQKIVDKIFQPFFTTKPTGQGTGLGLSLSYDIIKAHGGEIKVETKEGEGASFIIEFRLI